MPSVQVLLSRAAGPGATSDIVLGPGVAGVAIAFARGFAEAGSTGGYATLGAHTLAASAGAGEGTEK